MPELSFGNEVRSPRQVDQRIVDRPHEDDRNEDAQKQRHNPSRPGKAFRVLACRRRTVDFISDGKLYRVVGGAGLSLKLV